MNLEPFEPWHLHSFVPGEYDRRALRGVDLQALGEKAADKAVSVRDDGRTLGIAGITEHDDGTLEGWLFASDELRASSFFLHRVVKRVLPAVVEQCQLQGLEVRVNQHFLPAVRWAERLGFEVIGLESDGYQRMRLR